MNRLGVVLGCIGLLAGGALWLPAEGTPTICPLNLLTGLPCPTCGLGRSVCLFLHGDLVSALTINPCGPFVVVAAVVVLIAAVRGDAALDALGRWSTPAILAGLMAETLTSWPRLLAEALADGLWSALNEGLLTRFLLEVLHVQGP